jgi:hypothetical protein
MDELTTDDNTNPAFLVPVQTGISAAYWYEPADATYAPAKLATMTRADAKQTAWFDELFEVG